MRIAQVPPPSLEAHLYYYGGNLLITYEKDYRLQREAQNRCKRLGFSYFRGSQQDCSLKIAPVLTLWLLLVDDLPDLRFLPGLLLDCWVAVWYIIIQTKQGKSYYLEERFGPTTLKFPK